MDARHDAPQPVTLLGWIMCPTMVDQQPGLVILK